MITLGIESSCDETSVSIVKDGIILSNIISSQWMHQQYGGVVPELSARAHVRLITEITQHAFTQANLTKKDIDLIAVTYGPGLMGALLVGVNFAKSLAFALDKPLLGINHIESHLYANFTADKKPHFPFIGLIVSGGHTLLVRVNTKDNYILLGSTRDDAAGEAFDKIAKMLGLDYPGGPIIDNLAKIGNPKFIDFPRPMIQSNDFEFSFSGLKTSVLQFIKNNSTEYIKENLTHICASVQQAIVDVLVTKVIGASNQFQIKEIVVAGGVSANSQLRTELDSLTKSGYEIHFPPTILSTDNAAMVALLGELRFNKAIKRNLKLTPKSNLVITTERFQRT